MTGPAHALPPPVRTAMLCAGALGAQFIAGKAARDAIYLANLDVTTLPVMVIVTSLFSIVLVTANARLLRGIPPATFVPWAFGVSGLLLAVEWVLTHTAPRVAAPLVYLHVSGLGPMLSSGFWLIAAERFDPHTAKQRFGQIAGVGTLGGLASGLMAERVGTMFGTPAILLVLAALNGFCAWQVRQLAAGDAHGATRPPAADRDRTPAPSGFAAMAANPYIQNLAAVVFFGTLGSAVLDYLFKSNTVAAIGRGDSLVRFFSLYYTGVSLLTFVLQTTTSKWALERFGLGASASTPALALVAGSTGAVLVPGLGGIVAARAGESVLRGSVYRAAYEMFYTPMAAAEKRATKSIIDVGFDRSGDAVGGGVLWLLLLLAPAQRQPAGFVFTVVCALLVLAAAARLNRGYIQALEERLKNRAVDLDLSDASDLTTRRVMFNTLGIVSEPSIHPRPTEPVDPLLADIAALRSGDKARILRVLASDEPPPPPLVMHIVPLLERTSLADAASRALRRVSEWHVGLLTDTLLDPAQPFDVRRRLARVLAGCSSQRAVDGLMLGLDDPRFEVKVNCARSLAIVHGRNPVLVIAREVILRIIVRELSVGPAQWANQRLHDPAEHEREPAADDRVVRERAGASLTHVFTLLSLIVPAGPLMIAFHGLYSGDPHLRGTALEYLDGVLPHDVRVPLWPLLEGEPT